MSRTILLLTSLLVVSLLGAGCGSEEVEIPTSPRSGGIFPNGDYEDCVALCAQIRNLERQGLTLWYDECIDNPLYSDMYCEEERERRSGQIGADYLLCTSLCDEPGGGNGNPSPPPPPDDPNRPPLVDKKKL